MKILIAEDNRDLNDALVKGLSSRGFSVDSVSDGSQAVSKIELNEYDIIVLDINLPTLDGMKIAAEVRSKDLHVPLLALTARDKLSDKLKGFEIGFDDYLTKPFEFAELVARIEALIRRTKPNTELVLTVKNVELEPNKRIVLVDNKGIELTKIEFNILEYLLRQKGIVVSNSQLIEHVWAEEPDLIDPPIRSHIKNLRRKIKDHDFSIIKTLPGIGYKID